jgi:predicted transcriptional regulator
MTPALCADALNDERPVPAKYLNGQRPPPGQPIIKSSAEFVANFVPPDYLVHGLLIAKYLYALTGATGSGKTAITLRLAASVALGQDFAGLETTPRRVLYLAAENPIDVQMRWIALSQQMAFDADTIEVFFIEGVFRIAELDALVDEAKRVGGNFGLVIIDTGPAFYEGDDQNSRTQQQNHARLLRELITKIPGFPTVVANVHPVKNAQADNLLPAGGGTFLNEIDGNMTAAKTDTTVELHWLGKWRGVEFAPLNFLIKTVTHERLVDSRDKLMPTVICEHISGEAKDEIAKAAVTEQDRVLEFLKANPKASMAAIAIHMQWTLYSGEPNKMRASRAIKELTKAKLVEADRHGTFKVTEKGEKSLEETPTSAVTSHVTPEYEN